ncbi:ECF-type sigma factor [Kitasatospora purpeofusca]|uniref:ECF-type sigma factor n=1 Tax=Kitasatospora purpeofusca TaxID=67352 RepID=UPI002E14035F|nr:ECF-type sigma factor [Kitasatospora purpeofusca]WSR45251.1 ECF-type sigma factor [Kitasatospora purpeofusca]
MSTDPTGPATNWRPRANPAKLAADRELYEQLKADEFTGIRYTLFQEDLWRYGWKCLLAWMRDGSFVTRCQQRLIFFPAPFTEVEELSRREDAREEIAARALATALPSFTCTFEFFWEPGKGATIRTYFIGQCLFALRDAYREWATGHRRRHRAALDSDTVRSAESDPEHQALVLDSLQTILEGASIEARAVCNLMLTTGGTQEQIAEQLGTTRKSVERHLSRLRARARELAAAGTILAPSVRAAVVS